MRMYIQPSWTDAAEDHDLWSGGNGQYRGDPSINLSTFDAKGRARMEAFSDEAVEALKQKNKPKISIADKILPQQRRYVTLTNQMRELVADYKAGLYTIDEYTLLLNVLTVKRNRCEELLHKARSVKPSSASSTLSDDYTPIASNRYQIPVQNTGNEVKLAGHSAKTDLVYFLGGALALLVLVKLFF